MLYAAYEGAFYKAFWDIVDQIRLAQYEMFLGKAPNLAQKYSFGLS